MTIPSPEPKKLLPRKQGFLHTSLETTGVPVTGGVIFWDVCSPRKRRVCYRSGIIKTLHGFPFLGSVH